MRTSCCSADCKNCINGDSLSYGFANICALDPSSPLPCFSVFPSSEPLRCSPFSCATSKACSEEKGKKIAPPEEQTTQVESKKVCPCCGQAESEGSRLTPTPNENIYLDKSPEELRWQGMTMEKLDGLNKSTVSAQPQLVLPIFVLTMMPTCNSSGFGINPCAPSLSLTQIGTVPAFSLSAATNGVTIAPIFGTISGSPCITFGQSSGAIPLPNASGSSAGFSFGNGLSQNSGTTSFGSAAPTHCGTLTGCGTSQVTPSGIACNNTGKSFGAIPLHQHASRPSTGFGWPAHPGTTPPFGAPPAINHGAPTAPTYPGTTPFGTTCSNTGSGTSFGAIPSGSSPSFGLPANSGTASFGLAAPTHCGTLTGNGTSQATPFGTACNNTSKSFGAIPLQHHASRPSTGFGWPAHPGTTPPFGVPPAMNHGAPTAPTYRGTTPFGTACSNTGTSFGAIPSGSSPSFGLPANSGTLFGAPQATVPTHHGTFSTSQTTPFRAWSNIGKSFSGSSACLGLPANSTTTTPFGPGTSENSGTVSFGASAPTQHGTVSGAQATPLFGTACSNTNTGKSFGAISGSSTANSGTLASFATEPEFEFEEPSVIFYNRELKNQL